MSSPVDTSYVKDSVIFLTGGTAGIGKALLIELVKNHSPQKIVLLARNEDKVKALINDVSKLNSSVALDYVIADLAKPREVKQACNVIKTKLEHIDIFINNAGLYTFGKNKRLLTEDNLELHFVTNYLSMVIMLKELKQLLYNTKHRSGYSRLVITGSFTTWTVTRGKINFSSMQGEGKRRKTTANDLTYAQSKLLQHVYAKYFAETEVKNEGNRVMVSVFDPGMVETDIPAMDMIRKVPGWSIMKWLAGYRTPELGAAPGVYCCSNIDDFEKLFKEEGKNGFYIDWNLLGKGKRRKPVMLGLYPMANREAKEGYSEEVINHVVQYTEEQLEILFNGK